METSSGIFPFVLQADSVMCPSTFPPAARSLIGYELVHTTADCVLQYCKPKNIQYLLLE